jgi:Tol biopolymer transport system component
MSYPLRIAAVSLLLALLTALVLWRGPAARSVEVVIQAPDGTDVSVGAPIRIVFGQAVDRLSVEERFRLTPEAAGRFFWDGQAVTFQPDQPLRPDTTYQVTLEPGIADQAAQTTTQEPIRWTFRTRPSRLLLLRHMPDGASTLLLTTTDGSDTREVLREPGGIAAAIVAPDGSQALVTVPRSAERSALLLVNLESGSTRPLVEIADVSASAPAWAPDGNLIAFERRPLQADGVGDPAIWLAQPDGTSLGPVTEPDQRGMAPAWSPDSSRLAFYEAASEQVMLYDFRSTFQSFPASSSAPAIAWAPDSAALLYAGEKPGVLRYASLERGTTRDIVVAPDAAPGAVAWAPTGEWVAVAQQASPTAAGALWLLRPDGSAPRQLTTPGSASDSAPAWSPDGQQLAFLRTSSDGTSAAWLVDPASGEQRQVAADVAQVVWVP